MQKLTRFVGRDGLFLLDPRYVLYLRFGVMTGDFSFMDSLHARLNTDNLSIT